MKKKNSKAKDKKSLQEESETDDQSPPLPFASSEEEARTEELPSPQEKNEKISRHNQAINDGNTNVSFEFKDF